MPTHHLPAEDIDIEKLDFSQLTQSQFEKVMKRAQAEQDAREDKAKARKKQVSATWKEIKQRAGDLNAAFYESEADFIASAKTLYDELHEMLTEIPDGEQESLEDDIREHQRKAEQREKRKASAAQNTAQANQSAVQASQNSQQIFPPTSSSGMYTNSIRKLIRPPKGMPKNPKNSQDPQDPKNP